MRRWRAALCAGVLFTAGCSSFERDWEAAAKAPTPADALAGRWRGSWQSEVSGHSGGLRSIVTRRPEGVYNARYHATYGGTFTFEYTVPLTAERDGDALKFRGSADLGWLAGGVYEYDGMARGVDFLSSYRSKSDHGTFTMSREN